MKVGIGLPNAVADVTGDQLTGFARRAEAQGFSSLGTIDRIVYGNWAPLIALAAAATVTERIELMTTVMLGPLRLNPVQTAKQALTVNQLSGGRLTLGLGLGARGDDYEISGVENKDKARKFEAMLDEVERTFADERIGPRSAGVPRILIGGHADVSFRRAARYGDGWIAGGAPPDQYAEMAEQARKAWADAGNEGEPRLAALAYFALGDDAEATRAAIPDRLLRVPRRGDGADDRRQRRDRRRHGQGLPGRIRGRRLRRADHVPVLGRPRAGRSARRGGQVGSRDSPSLAMKAETQSARATIRSRRHRQPKFFEAVIADARIASFHSGRRFDSSKRLRSLFGISSLIWSSDGFLAQVVYRFGARMWVDLVSRSCRGSQGASPC